MKKFQVGEMDVIGNVLRGGASTEGKLPMILMGGDGDLKLFKSDNISIDRYGAELPLIGRYSMGMVI